MKTVAVIPARYASSRFPGKPLAAICKKPMIQWVYEAVSSVPAIQETIVATDDRRIFEKVISFGGNAAMTGDCCCGTDRVYEIVKEINCDMVLNIQGDEPLIKARMIQKLIHVLENHEEGMVTLKKEISYKESKNPDIVKVVTDINDYAIYFSRYAVPYCRNGEAGRYYKHIGIYGYSKAFLQVFVNFQKSTLEKAESLEQLRALENGYKIKVIETKYDTVSVDLPEHIAKVEKIMEEENEMQNMRG